MKAILIIDMPSSCIECPFYENEYGYYCAGIAEKCPLKPFPQELPTPYLFRQMQIADGLQNEDGSVPVYSEDYMIGWNDCIGEILGEKE